jgi:hypothetical protein
MNPSMNQRRTLAAIERRLIRDDPELSTRMDTLNHQFRDVSGDHQTRRDRWKLAAAMLATVALLGLILAALLAKQSLAEDHRRSNGLASAVSIQSQQPDHLERTAYARA